jgi:hypothetical protein
MTTIAVEYIIEQVAFLSQSIFFVIACGFQIFIVWPQDKKRVRVNQKFSIVPTFLLNLVVTVICIDVRCVYGIYNPSIVIGLTYLAMISMITSMPQWAYSISKVKADELNVDIQSLGLNEGIAAFVTVLTVVFPVGSCTAVLITRKLLYGSAMLFPLFGLAGGSVLLLLRLYWIIWNNQQNMSKSGVIGMQKHAYEKKILRNIVISSLITPFILAFACFLCIDPYFSQLNIDTLLETKDPNIYTFPPITFLFIFLSFSASSLFTWMGWVSPTRTHKLKEQVSPLASNEALLHGRSGDSFPGLRMKSNPQLLMSTRKDIPELEVSGSQQIIISSLNKSN